MQDLIITQIVAFDFKGGFQMIFRMMTWGVNRSLRLSFGTFGTFDQIQFFFFHFRSFTHQLNMSCEVKYPIMTDQISFFLKEGESRGEIYGDLDFKEIKFDLTRYVDPID